MGLLGRLLGQRGTPPAPPDPRTGAMVARVVALHPRLKLAPRCEARLAGPVGSALAHIGTLMADVPRSHGATAADWSADPYMRAYFAAADDIPAALARSQALHDFFDQSPGADEAFAVMGMEMTERRTLGVAQVGDTTRSDVAQTTVGFSDHQIRLCGAGEDGLREEITRRLVDQIAIEALARSAADASLRDDLEEERALLASRLRMLEREGAGVRSMLAADGSAGGPDLAQLRADAQRIEQQLQTLGPRSEALARQLDAMCEAFQGAARLLHVSTRTRRLSRMNVVVDELGSAAGATDSQSLRFNVARVPGDPPAERAFALLRVARADLPNARSLLDHAERLL